MGQSDSSKRESDMNSNSRHQSHQSRAIAGRLARYAAYWINRATIRRIERLPENVKRDIGWPPYGDLDHRDRS
jgi:hypothetical protein